MRAARVALAALLLACGSAAASDRFTDVRQKVRQGELVVGRTAAGNAVRLDQRALRVDAEGRFAFGVGRDEAGPLNLHVRWFDGAEESVRIEVVARDWPIEHVTGVPQDTVTPPPAIAERIAREQAQVAAARQRDDARADLFSGFRWPTRGRISGVYGSQRIYNGTPRSPHSGLDVAVPTGTPLAAPAPGIVSFAAPDLYLTGGTVLIDHGHGVSSVFLHLSRIDVTVGQRVEAGQVFGAVGATGRASGPHMHWGLNWFDVRLDPALLQGIGDGPD